MSLTLIRSQLIRSYQSLVDDSVANPETDVDQLSGNELLIKRDGTNTKTISKLTSQDTAGEGAALVGINATGSVASVSTKTVQGALEWIATNAGKFLGTYASVAGLPAPSSLNSGKTALVYNSAAHTEDGMYESNGSTWTRKGAIIDFVGSQYEVDASIDLNGNEILGLPSTPSVGAAAASKTYVDSLIAGRKWKDPVHYKADIIDTVNGNFPAAAAGNSGKYAFATSEDSSNGVLYISNGVAWNTVSPASGELLMLNDTESDDVLKYVQDVDGWDYDDTDGRVVVTSANDTRIYMVDDNAYTYDADSSSWVLADSTGGIIGDRAYTEENWVSDGETVTTSIDKLDMELFDLYAAVGLAANEGVANLTYRVTPVVVSNGTTLETAVGALDSKWEDLAAVTVGKGATLVGIYDTTNHYTGTTVEAALKEIGDNLYRKGYYGYKQGAGSGGAGSLAFSNGAPTITLTASNFAAIASFMNQTGDNTWGTDAAGDFSAVNALIQAGFDLQIEVDGTAQPARYVTWTNSSNTLVIKLDGNLKNNDFVSVRLVRNAYKG